MTPVKITPNMALAMFTITGKRYDGDYIISPEQLMSRRLPRSFLQEDNVMDVELLRFKHSDDYTIGMWSINGVFECFTLEDEKRTKKVYGETRFEEGEYEIGLRKVGGFHNRYLKKFGPDFHKGMLCIFNAPDWKIITPNMIFQYILFHIGNDDDDTAGCVLSGNSADTNKGLIGHSTAAYKKVYPKIATFLEPGGKVKLRVISK